MFSWYGQKGKSNCHYSFQVQNHKKKVFKIFFSGNLAFWWLSWEAKGEKSSLIVFTFFTRLRNSLNLDFKKGKQCSKGEMEVYLVWALNLDMTFHFTQYPRIDAKIDSVAWDMFTELFNRWQRPLNEEVANVVTTSRIAVLRHIPLYNQKAFLGKRGYNFY